MVPFSSHLRHRLRRHGPRHNCYRSAFQSAGSQPPPSHVQPLHVPLCHPAYFVWSANTSLGKTLVSAGLASSFLLSSSSSLSKKFVYLKPVQTGFPTDSDSRFVFSRLSSLSLLRRIPLSLSHSVVKSSISAANSLVGSHSCDEEGICDLDFREERHVPGARELVCKTLYAWEAAVSPHLAVDRENAVVEDSVVLNMLERCLREEMDSGHRRQRMDFLSLIETAGGVASPGPSGTLQCDLYRPLRLPGILVGDGRLGGISATISSYESLKLRGYDVIAVVMEDHGLANEVPLMSYLQNRVPVLVLPSIPKDPSDDLTEWFAESNNVFALLKGKILFNYSERLQRLNDMPKQAGDVFWWPFTQHSLISEKSVTVIDSRYGENFAVYEVQEDEFLTQQFDACASWWTQGPDPALQAELAREMGYASARFGHVMFPENVYEPALQCAEALLDGVGKGWASRVFFSDNGSTATEVALKMAFRKFCFDHGILLNYLEANESEKCLDIKVLALRGSYHGDTLGAMEAQAPSSYTGFLQQPWYTGRGIFLDPPTVFMHNSIWTLLLPESLTCKAVKGDELSFITRDEIFDRTRDKSNLAGIYASYVSGTLLQYSQGFNCVGALIIEPVIHGAGGMHMVDPLFQRVLVNECRKRKIPVIFDEVFTGFWRLGAETAAELLGCAPDVACYAKLLTGGIVPLSVTLATDAVFRSFAGDSKLQALLHGHSYSAHAMGCSAAVKAIKWFKDPLKNLNLTSEGTLLRELWDSELVTLISSHPAAKRVVVLGTLFVLELRAHACDSGYASLYAKSLLNMLQEDGIYMRPLGNVIYLMCGPCTSPDLCRQLLVKLYKRLEDFGAANSSSM